MDSLTEFDAASHILDRRSRPIWRRRLNILYLLHDSLHHTRYHESKTRIFSTFSDGLEDVLLALLRGAAQCRPEVHAQHHQRLQELLELWEDPLFFDPPYCKRLRLAVDEGIKQSKSQADLELELPETRSQGEKHMPYILPPSHGDSATPFYDLPAGNMIPHITPNSTQPIDHQLVKPLQFNAGPADEGLVRAVNEVIDDTGSSDHSTMEDESQGMPDTDLIGQAWFPNSGLERNFQGKGYYGWSRGFCEKMRMAEGVNVPVMLDGAGEVGPKGLEMRKRRRASSPEASEISRTTSFARSRTSSQKGFGQRDSRSRSYSPELHHDATVEQDTFPTGEENTKHLRGRSPPYDPRRPRPSSQEVPMLAQAFIGDMPSVAQKSGSSTMNMAIPPRPPNYDGLWPPPPPPPAPQHLPVLINRYNNPPSQAASQPSTRVPQYTEGWQPSAASGPAQCRTSGWRGR